MDLNKLLSGRFIFTVVSALVFAYVSLNKVISSEQIYSVITLIIGFYFGRSDRLPEQPKKDNGNEKIIPQ